MNVHAWIHVMINWRCAALDVVSTAQMDWNRLLKTAIRHDDRRSVMGLDTTGYAMVEAERGAVADLKSIAAGLSSPQRVCQERNMATHARTCVKPPSSLKYAREIGMEVLGEPLRPSFDGGPIPGRTGFHGNATSQQSAA